MIVTPLAEDPLEILVRHIVDGTLNASPQGIAIIAWLCDFHATEPTIAEISETSDGWLIARHTGEIAAESLGPREAFYAHLRLVCANCGLTDAQTDRVESIAKRKAGTP